MRWDIHHGAQPVSSGNRRHRPGNKSIVPRIYHDARIGRNPRWYVTKQERGTCNEHHTK